MKSNAALLGFIALAACAIDPGSAVDRAPIVGGTIDDGDPAVYFVANGASSCTGALVSPHVVLTARHCVVQPDSDELSDVAAMRVFVGSGPDFETSYRVAAVHVVPGSTTAGVNSGRPDDIGLIVLTTAAAETPLTMDRGAPMEIIGQPFTSIGFGRTPDGTLGRKRRVTTRIDRIEGGTFYTPPAVCPGDSGGPGIGPNGHVYGVATFYYSPDGVLECGTSLGGYNAIDLHRAWIDSVIEAVGDACFPDLEVCDSVDNDCNGTIDDDCLADGAPCTDASECLGLMCEETSMGRLCTRACDVTHGSAACGDGLHCVHTADCTGLCLPAAGEAHDAPCTTDAECASGSCTDPGDGRRRCLVLCRGDEGGCTSGETCTGAPGACGACVAESLVAAQRGLGEECRADSECRSGRCFVRAGIGECVTSCGETCAAGFVCQGERCVLDRRQPAGGPCVAASDCASNHCVTQGARGWCSVDDCSVTPCPEGFGCVDVGGPQVCVPSLALQGEACGATDDCASGTCIAGACSASCEEASDCGPGLRCVRAADGLSASCVRPGAPVTSSCAIGSRRAATPIAWLLCVCLVVLRRARASSERKRAR